MARVAEICESRVYEFNARMNLCGGLIDYSITAWRIHIAMCKLVRRREKKKKKERKKKRKKMLIIRPFCIDIYLPGFFFFSFFFFLFANWLSLAFSFRS